MRARRRLRGEITVTMKRENVRVSVIWRDYSDVVIWYTVRPNAGVLKSEC
jgi:hypothetical protein